MVCWSGESLSLRSALQMTLVLSAKPLLGGTGEEVRLVAVIVS